MSQPPRPDSVDAGLARVRSKSGKSYWRGLEELFDQPSFRQRIASEFPALAKIADGWDRRGILKCLGASMALLGLDGCERGPDETSFPYVNTPEGATPGEPRYYASTVEIDGVGQPIIGKCVDGRPIKLEGNPDHPASGGATDAFTQAALLGLYDPDRSATPRNQDETATWDAFREMTLIHAQRLDTTQGEGFHLLTGPVGSPTLLRQIAQLRARWPQMRWHVHAPLAGYFASAATAAFGRPLTRQLRLDLADIIVSLDDDVLGTGPYQTWQARGWSARRRAYQRGQGSALLMVAEPSPTPTGAVATDRLVARHRQIGDLLVALAAKLGVGAYPAPALNSRARAWVAAAAQALQARPGKGLLTVGEHHSPELQQLALAINGSLGNLGKALRLIEPPALADGDLFDLTREMMAERVGSLFVLDANPAYSAPADLNFALAMKRVPLRIHAGLHRDETAALSTWHVPIAHDLESWSDARAADGSASLIQPLVRPFLDVRSRHAVLSALGGAQQEDRDIVRETWLADWGGDEARWKETLVKGLLAQDPLQAAAISSAPAPAQLPPTSSPQGLQVLFRADPTIHDGRFASNPWLQEMPKPMTKLTWDNAIHVSPALAAQLNLSNEQVVDLVIGTRKVRGAVWIMPGQERGTVLVHLGYGRRAGGRVAQDCGFDANALRTSAEPWAREGATIRPTGDHYDLACTQIHAAMEGHDFVRFVEAAGESLPRTPPKPNFYPPQPKNSPSWGMAIDLDLCIGCNACATACVAENNVAMVGKEQVSKGREMHWLRIDRYYEGSPEEPKHVFQPVPCMHCEDAPCEMGCPVNATVHSPDGLNLQVYNRCIGTRTCQSYCPYKVRRFNWLDYVRDDPPEMRAVRNPDVTVRDRGVMEKCTYCIQRTRTVGIAADIAGRPIAEGEVKTACQQACPTQAITFGDVSRPDSAVSRAKADGRDYSLLEEANTRPRTTYAARIERGEAKA